MADSVMTKELAEKEVNLWFDFKRIKTRKREENGGSIESLIDGFMSGSLTIDPDTAEISLKLSFPLGSNNIEKLVFKPRLKVREAHKHLKNVSASDVDGRILAYVSALTDQNSGVVKEMDTEDYSLAQSIAIFFF